MNQITPEIRHIVLDGYPFRKYKWSDGSFYRKVPSYRQLKNHLVHVYKTCYFCSIDLIQYSHVDGSANNEPDRATIEHLTPKPVRKRYERTKKVLCCYRCNQERNISYLNGERQLDD